MPSKNPRRGPKGGIVKLRAVPVRCNVRAFREARGMTGRELAKRVGILPTNLCHYEAGRILPSVIMGQRIARALGVVVGELWPLEDDDGLKRCVHGKSPLETCTEGLCFREVELERVPVWTDEKHGLDWVAENPKVCERGADSEQIGTVGRFWTCQRCGISWRVGEDPPWCRVRDGVDKDKAETERILADQTSTMLEPSASTAPPCACRQPWLYGAHGPARCTKAVGVVPPEPCLEPTVACADPACPRCHV